MKPFKYLLLLAISCFAGVSQAQGFNHSSAGTMDIETGVFRMPILTGKKGYLDTTKLALGTILKSHHFNGGDYNETHNGIYLNIEKWSLGTYNNSANVQSNFVTYDSDIYSRRNLKVGLMVGIADGYKGWELVYWLPHLDQGILTFLIDTAVPGCDGFFGHKEAVCRLLA